MAELEKHWKKKRNKHCLEIISVLSFTLFFPLTYFLLKKNQLCLERTAGKVKLSLCACVSAHAESLYSLLKSEHQEGSLEPLLGREGIPNNILEYSRGKLGTVRQHSNPAATSLPPRTCKSCLHLQRKTCILLTLHFWKESSNFNFIAAAKKGEMSSRRVNIDHEKWSPEWPELKARSVFIKAPTHPRTYSTSLIQCIPSFSLHSHFLSIVRNLCLSEAALRCRRIQYFCLSTASTELNQVKELRHESHNGFSLPQSLISLGYNSTCFKPDVHKLIPQVQLWSEYFGL